MDRLRHRDLIDAADLKALIGDPRLRIADVRWQLLDPEYGRRAYASGHLPGAVFIDLPTILSATVGSGPGRHPLPSPARFAADLGGLGIGDEHLVIAYDDAGGTTAARLWWMLRDLGHDAVAVLDGGVAAWIDAGGELSTEPSTHLPARLRLADRWRTTIERATLRDRLGDITLLDARATERYRGDTEPIDPVAGHIPTARSLPATELLDAAGALLPPDELAARLGAAGVDPARPVVVSCGSGVTAAQLALAISVAGLPEPLLYEGSFSDWSRSGLPVATGDDPGSPGSRPGGPADPAA
jgi:thiosulfate/3-mercaptopyruvate sulfurtransferase